MLRNIPRTTRAIQSRFETFAIMGNRSSCKFVLSAARVISAPSTSSVDPSILVGICRNTRRLSGIGNGEDVATLVSS